MNDDNTTPDYGYDPTVSEDIEIIPPEPVATVPSAATVNRQYLPPVGEQGTTQSPGYPGSCAAWASTYGLATFTGAKAGNYSPTTAAQQASPAYIYIQVLEGKTPPCPDACSGSQFSAYFKILSQGGTANMEQAPYVAKCKTLWTNYAGVNLPPDPAFALGKVAAVKTDDLESIKQIIVSDRALVYGTKLYSDWGAYNGDPVPYVGNGQIVYNKKTGKPAGHCLLIIGYDDTQQALLIQNSQSTAWGSDGYVWMAYATFTALAQGTAFYLRA